MGRIFDALPDDLNDEQLEAIPAPPEQVGPRSSVRGTEREDQLNAIQAEITAVIEDDRWPKELLGNGMKPSTS